MKKLLCPSMMCADFGNLRSEVHKLEEANVDIFHLDVMDGDFVPNFGMGLQDIEFIIKESNITCDVHLMVNNPSSHVDKFIDMGVDIIYIHPESENEPLRTLAKIKEAGVQAGIAINPSTSVESIKVLLNVVDKVMVMTVSPGFAGQKYIPFIDDKIAQLVELQSDYDYEIFVDGAISPERVETLSKNGVKGFVLGTSALFGKDKSYKELITELQAL